MNEESDNYVPTDADVYETAVAAGQQLVTDFTAVLTTFLQERLFPWIETIVATGNDPTPVAEAFAETLRAVADGLESGFRERFQEFDQAPGE